MRLAVLRRAQAHVLRHVTGAHSPLVRKVQPVRGPLVSAGEYFGRRGLVHGHGHGEDDGHTHSHTHSHSHGHSHDAAADESPKSTRKVPTITKTMPLRPWMEPPVDLKELSFEDARTLWVGFGGEPEDLSPSEDYVVKVAEKAFQLAVTTLASARNDNDLEESRSLLATAAAHGSEKARLYCARLLMIGKWPVSLSTPEEEEEEEVDANDKRTAKEKGMEVIRQIRAIQKKRKKGERYDSKPPKDIKQSLSILRDLGQNARDSTVRGSALLELGDAHFFPHEALEDDNLPELVPAVEALAAYEAAAKECSAPGAWYRLGSALLEGSAEVQPDEQRARECFERAMESEDDTDARFFLGHLLKETNPDVARKHLLEAAEKNNHSQAMVYLARWAIEQGKDEEAKDWLLKAERLGDAEALHILADSFLAGSLGFEKDLQRALRYYLMAGAAGSVEALLSAGAMYYNMEEFEEAFKCYESAAEGYGSVEAWQRMAHLYLTGQGVRKDPETAQRIWDLVGKPEPLN